MELLKKLYEIHSPSGNENRIKRFIKRYIRKNIPSVTIESDKTGNLYITKGRALEYPCIIAHLDQVQESHSADFKAIEAEDIIIGYSVNNRTQEGLGADDKNGCWVALKSLARFDNLKVAFFVQEEIGCVGSSKAEMRFFDDCRFVIEPDRRGNSDFISSIGWNSLCSDEFINDVGFGAFGYKEQTGAMTDILALKEQGLPISCCNLSCGYYQPHTDQEFTVKADLQNCLNLVYHIIENCTRVYPHQGENLWNYQEHYSSPNFIDEYFEMEMIISELYQLDPTITPDEIYNEYSGTYKALKLEDIEELLYSQKQTYLDF